MDIVPAGTVLGASTVWQIHKITDLRKKRGPMKKIVIFSDNSDRSFSQAMALNALFPECEIEIRSVISGDKKEDLFTDKKTKLRNSGSDF
jgi:hypothetical protein